MNTSIRAASLTLRELVGERLRLDANLRAFFDPALGGTMEASLQAPEDMFVAPLEGVSLWLYRIERDEQTLNQPRRRDHDRLIDRPLPLKLHYLVVPVVQVATRADGPELEHNIMGVVLQTFHDHPTLRGADLRGDLAGSSQELNVRFETLDLDQMSRMWESMNREFQLCISYEVAVVPIDSAMLPARAPSVDVVEPQYGIITSVEGA